MKVFNEWLISSFRVKNGLQHAHVYLFRVCLTCAIRTSNFLLKNNNNLLKSYISNIK